jgi:hypothetical protein
MSTSQQQRTPSGGDDRIRDTRTSGANLTKKMVRSIPVSDSTKCAVTFAFYTPDDRERNNRKMSQVCHHRGSKGGGRRRTKRALSKAPAMMPAMKAAQFKWPISAGTDTNVFVTGEFS